MPVYAKEERSRANMISDPPEIPRTVLWDAFVCFRATTIRWAGVAMDVHFTGAPGIVWAFIWWKLIDERPMNAKWLTEDEKRAVEERFARGAGGH